MICRSVGLSVCLDPDAIWHHRSDGSRDEAVSGVWGSVHGKGYFWGEFGARHCPQGPIERTCATALPLAKLLWADLFFIEVGCNVTVDSFKHIDVPAGDDDDNLLSLRVKSKEELVGTQNLPSTNTVQFHV